MTCVTIPHWVKLPSSLSLIWGMFERCQNPIDYGAMSILCSNDVNIVLWIVSFLRRQRGILSKFIRIPLAWIHQVSYFSSATLCSPSSRFPGLHSFYLFCDYSPWPRWLVQSISFACRLWGFTGHFLPERTRQEDGARQEIGRKLSIVINYTPAQRSCWGGGGGGGGLYWFHSVRPSVRPASRVRSVAPAVLVGSISYLHILSNNFRRCVACEVSCKISKFVFLAFFLNL